MANHVVGAIIMALCLILFGIVFLGVWLKLIPLEYGVWIVVFALGMGYYGAVLMDQEHN